MSAIRTIKTGIRQLGIAEDDERNLYHRLTNERSVRKMTPLQLLIVVDELRRLGFKPKSGSNQGGRQGKPALDGKYLGKLRSLWIALYNLGVVKDRRDSAMESFVLGRQVEVAAIRFIHTPGDAAAAIEALKAMAARAGVDWNNNAGQPKEMRAMGYKIAWAQWRKLVGGQEPIAGAFWLEVEQLVGRSVAGRPLDQDEWISVMNAFGERVRAAKREGGK